MRKNFVLILLLLFVSVASFSQTDTSNRISQGTSSVTSPDSANALADTTKPLTDSLFQPTVAKPKILTWKEDTLFNRFFTNPYLLKNTKPVMMISDERESSSKDELFYLLAGITFYFAFLKITFPKYFQNIFKLLFQSSFFQKHGKEVMSQDNLPSLLFNLLFIISGGLFLTLLSIHYQWLKMPFWLMLFYASVTLAVIYFGKFLFISFAGWVFNAGEAAKIYNTIIFLVNKIIGIVLIPLLLLFAFSDSFISNDILSICYIVFIILLAYRYLASFNLISGTLKINPIHFFVYLCAVEILPLLIIYKVIINLIR